MDFQDMDPMTYSTENVRSQVPIIRHQAAQQSLGYFADHSLVY
jgi:hypothetical protein